MSAPAGSLVCFMVPAINSLEDAKKKKEELNGTRLDLEILQWEISGDLE